MDVRMNLNPKYNCRKHFIVIIITVIRENNRDYPNYLHIFLPNMATEFVAECHLIRQIISLSIAWQQKDIQSLVEKLYKFKSRMPSEKVQF